MSYDYMHQPWRGRAAECTSRNPFEQRGWWQDGFIRPVKKPHYAFIWPKDRKNRGKWSRLKDILTGKGPDIHLTVSADKQDYMFNRPKKPTWGLHTDLDDEGSDSTIPSPFPWVNKRELSGQKYDFKTRRFRYPFRGMRTDARWPEGRHHRNPEAYRDIWGYWWQDSDAVPFYLHRAVFGDPPIPGDPF